MNYKKMDPKRVAQMLEEGRSHLEFMASIYNEQLRHGRHFLHEHPATALSWKEEPILKLLQTKVVGQVVCDQ